MANRFPLHRSVDPRREKSLPWAAMEPLRVQLELHHRTTLERLAQVGGLSYGEIGLALCRMEVGSRGLTGPEIADLTPRGKAWVDQVLREEQGL